MIRNKLKYWRHILQIDTQKEFADLLGIHQSLLNRYELQRQQPSLEIAFRISKRLGKPIEELFEPPED